MNIVIAGYYGFGNLGDELILSTILSQIHDRYPSSRITILSANPEETKRLHQTEAVSRWNPFQIITTVWKNDLLILGGGGLIQNGTSNRSLIYYLGLIGLARLFHSSVLLYALGVEAIGPSWSAVLRWLLSVPKIRITVRDTESKEKFIFMGLSPENIHVTADPVFGRPVLTAPTERYRESSGLKVLLIPRFPEKSNKESLFAVFHRILAGEKHMDVKGMVFQPSVESRFAKSFSSSQHPPLEIIPPPSIHSTVSEIAAFDMVISARFHGLVLAALASRPFIGIGDPDKIKRLCEALNMPFLGWNADEKTVRAAIETLLSTTVSENDVQTVEKLKRAAIQTADYLI